MANNLSDFTVIEVIPTLQATAYTTARMVNVTTEIPNAVEGSKGCSKLVGLTIVNKADATFLGDIIFQSASTTHGAINAAPGMSVGDLASAGVLGTIKIETEDWTDFGAGQVCSKLNSDVLNTVPLRGKIKFKNLLELDIPSPTPLGIQNELEKMSSKDIIIDKKLGEVTIIINV